MRLDVVEVDREGLERIASGVRFDDEPTASRLFGFIDYTPEWQRALADGAVDRLPVNGDRIVLYMPQGQAVAQPPAPFHAVSPSVLDPIGVDLAGQIVRIGVGIKVFQDGGVLKPHELDVVVVIGEGDPCFPERRASLVQLPGKITYAIRVPEIYALWKWIGGELTSKRPEPVDDFLGLIEKQ